MMSTVVSKHDSADEYGLVVIAASFTMHKKDSFNDLFSKLCRGLKPRTPARQGACPSPDPTPRHICAFASRSLQQTGIYLW